MLLGSSSIMWPTSEGFVKVPEQKRRNLESDASESSFSFFPCLVFSLLRKWRTTQTFLFSKSILVALICQSPVFILNLTGCFSRRKIGAQTVSETLKQVMIRWMNVQKPPPTLKWLSCTVSWTFMCDEQQQAGETVRGQQLFVKCSLFPPWQIVFLLKPSCSCLSSPCSRRQSRMAFSGRDVFEQAVSAKLFSISQLERLCSLIIIYHLIQVKHFFSIYLSSFVLNFCSICVSILIYFHNTWPWSYSTWFTQRHIILRKNVCLCNHLSKCNNLLRLWNDFPFQMTSSSPLIFQFFPYNHLSCRNTFLHPVHSFWIK